MKRIILLQGLFLFSVVVYGQDYYEDANGNGFPININTNGGLFGARANIKDNSIKLNFFKFFKSNEIYSDPHVQRTFVEDGSIIPSVPAEPMLPKATNKWGLGINIKGKTEQNLGSLFSSGVFAPGFSGGIYIVKRKIKEKPDPCDATKTKAAFATLLFSAQYSASSYRLYDNARLFDKMKFDTAFNGYSLSFAWFRNVSVDKKYAEDGSYLGRVSNLIYGISVELARKNNYNRLDKYEIKDYLTQVIEPSTGTSRTIQMADEEGYGYSKNGYIEYISFKIRPHINYIPGLLNNRVGMIFYPSYDILEKDKPRLNFGLGFHLLEKGIPALSNAGIMFEFNDIKNNANVKDKTFLERSFSVSIGASFFMFTGKQR